MATQPTTTIERAEMLIENRWSRDAIITATGAITIKRGTLLARQTSTQKLIPYVKGGTTDGDGNFVAVALEEHVFTGAGDAAARPSFQGDYRKHLLIIQADGDATNIDDSVVDLMAARDCRARDVEQTAKTDL